MEFISLFSNTKPIIGVVHLLPLPGSPKFNENLDEIANRALEEVRILKLGGVDGIIIENFHDKPFINGSISLEQFGVMASILTMARHEINVPIGVNVHFNDWQSELSLAYACKAQFIRVEGFINTVITPSGIVEPCCAEVTRYRKALGINESVQIWADVHPKYSKNLIHYCLSESARMAQEALADCLIVTGETTGVETPLDDIRKVKQATQLPVFVGSGVNLSNIEETLAIADGVIVGSALKPHGNTDELISYEKLTKLMKAVNEYRFPNQGQIRPDTL